MIEMMITFASFPQTPEHNKKETFLRHSLLSTFKYKKKEDAIQCDGSCKNHESLRILICEKNMQMFFPEKNNVSKCSKITKYHLNFMLKQLYRVFNWL